MGYKTKKPADLKVKKTNADVPSYYTRNLSKDQDYSWWNDNQISDYLGTRMKNRDWPVWTTKYGYGHFTNDYARLNRHSKLDSFFKPMSDEHQGYYTLNEFSKEKNYRQPP